jgi:predicted nucleotidyltransferase
MFVSMITLRSLFERRGEILGLAEQYHAGNVRVFGSVARGDNTESSDVDLLINTKPGCSLFHLGGLLEDLKDLLKCPVDMVTEDGLKPAIRERVLREAIPL